MRSLTDEEKVLLQKLSRPKWQRAAGCLGLGFDTFVAIRLTVEETVIGAGGEEILNRRLETDAEYAARLRIAEEACSGCAVHLDCLALALITRDGETIMGGTTPGDRVEILACWSRMQIMENLVFSRSEMQSEIAKRRNSRQPSEAMPHPAKRDRKELQPA